MSSAPILVTGAQGYLGRYTVAALLARGERVVGTGRSPALDGVFAHAIESPAGNRPAPLPADLRAALASGGYRYVRCDLAEPDQVEALLADVRPARILHLAGALRDEAWPTLARANVMATITLARLAAALPDKPPLVVGSSGSVYGEQESQPISEDAPPRPIGAYATSKYMAELAALAIGQDNGMAVSVARIFNLMGPGLQQRHLASLLAHAVADIEAGRAPARLTLGDLSTVRDCIDVRDAATALALWPVDAPPVVNLAFEALPVQQIVDRIVGASIVPIEIAFEAARSRPGAQLVAAQKDRMLAFHRPVHGILDSADAMLAYARAALN